VVVSRVKNPVLFYVFIKFISDFSSLLEYSDFAAMHDDLEDDQLDGLLIDRYQASHLLYHWNEDGLRVLENIDAETHYKMVRVVGRNDAIGTNDCFTERINRHKRLTQKFANKYVKPVKVRKPSYFLSKHFFSSCKS